jgi:hypothetical protein
MEEACLSDERRKGELEGLLGEDVNWVGGVVDKGRTVRGVDGVVRF